MPGRGNGIALMMCRPSGSQLNGEAKFGRSGRDMTSRGSPLPIGRTQNSGTAQFCVIRPIFVPSGEKLRLPSKNLRSPNEPRVYCVGVLPGGDDNHSVD